MSHKDTAQNAIDDHKNNVDALQNIVSAPKPDPQEVQEFADCSGQVN